jgi:outer membrane protein assembly factor BamD
MNFRLSTFAVAVCLALPACAGAQVAGTSAPDKTVAGDAKPAEAKPGEAKAEAALPESEQLYLDAMEHMAGGSLIEAEAEFHKILKMPSYLKVTALARLRLGDAQYAQHKYDESIETYLSFVQRHDTNENVPYALFMVAKAHFQLAPDDFFILPPQAELDLGPVQQARSHLERFIRQFPRSRFVTEATLLRDRCLSLQFAHHEYVVNFYQRREKWLSLVFRMHLAMQQFPSRARTLANYELLADCYGKLAWRTRAIELWTAVGQRYPGESVRAEKEIALLNAAIATDKAKGLPGDMPVELPPTASYKPELATESEDS